MRRLGQGHRIHIVIIPEVLGLIRRELVLANCAHLIAEGAGCADVLRGVTAWLIINSMKSDRTQFQQLLVQNSANVSSASFSSPVTGYRKSRTEPSQQWTR